MEGGREVEGGRERERDYRLNTSPPPQSQGVAVLLLVSHSTLPDPSLTYSTNLGLTPRPSNSFARLSHFCPARSRRALRSLYGYTPYSAVSYANGRRAPTFPVGAVRWSRPRDRSAERAARMYCRARLALRAPTCCLRSNSAPWASTRRCRQAFTLIYLCIYVYFPPIYLSIYLYVCRNIHQSAPWASTQRCRQVFTLIYICIYVYVCLLYIYIYIHICIYICMYIYIYIYLLSALELCAVGIDPEMQASGRPPSNIFIYVYMYLYIDR